MRAITIVIISMLSGCSGPPAAYTTASVLSAVDECESVGLSAHWTISIYTGKVIGHQCLP
jgi:hypothetical protein